ncbi:MAG: T9SS type A sorting domain-containing protein, partial [Ignavibacteriota bacterium]
QRIGIDILDVGGREIRNYPTQEFSAGKNVQRLDTRGLQSGMYFLRLKTEQGVLMQKFVVMR